LPTAIPLLALPRHAMAHNIRALTVGAVKHLKNHESTLVCWSFSAARPRIEDSRSTPLKHLQRAICVFIVEGCSLAGGSATRGRMHRADAAPAGSGPVLGPSRYDHSA